MLDESLRTRLEALNRAHSAVQSTPISDAATTEPIQPSSGRDSATAPHAQRPTTRPASPHPKFTPGLLRTRRSRRNRLTANTCRIRLPVESLWPNGPQLIAARQEYLQSQLAAAQQAIEPTIAMSAEFASMVASLPDRTVALDLETCGLAGSALFLVGLLHQVDGRPTVELLLARNYAEEAAVLASLWQTIADHDVLLTFNGKSFDWPMVIERSIRHRLQVGTSARSIVHIDILAPRPPPLEKSTAELPAANAGMARLPPPPRGRHPGPLHPGRLRRLRPHRF